MKIFAFTAIVVALVTSPALAQRVDQGVGGATAVPQQTRPSAKLSVETTEVKDILKIPEAKAALEAVVPGIEYYYALIATMTLRQVVPVSEGELDDAKLRAIQTQFNKINMGSH